MSRYTMTNQITEELVYWGRAEPPTDETLEETDPTADLEEPRATDD